MASGSQTREDLVRMFCKIPGLADFYYYTYGRGPKTLFCFHGFGFNGEQFQVLQASLGDEYTFVSFDLPFHGKTRILDQEIVAKGFKNEDFYALIDAYCKQHQVGRFSIASFSIGSKLAVVLAAHFASRMDELFLFAADGVEPNRFYQFATHTRLGNALFRYLRDKPQFLLSLADFLVKIGLISKKLAGFASLNFDSQEKRELVYATWMSLRNIRVKTAILLLALNSNPVHCRIFAGEKDQVIRIAVLRDFARKLKKGSFTALPYGHLLLKYPDLNSYISGDF